VSESRDVIERIEHVTNELCLPAALGLDSLPGHPLAEIVEFGRKSQILVALERNLALEVVQSVVYRCFSLICVINNAIGAIGLRIEVLGFVDDLVGNL
jgi:hypothetical protein